jgi:DNA-binding GntR family transcriptional regulator
MPVSAIRVDSYVLGTLMADLVGHDRSPSSFLVYLALWARTGGSRGAMARMSHRDLAEETGLSKSAVQAAVRNLARRRLITFTRASATAVPEYTIQRPWIRRRAASRT